MAVKACPVGRGGVVLGVDRAPVGAEAQQQLGQVLVVAHRGLVQRGGAASMVDVPAQLDEQPYRLGPTELGGSDDEAWMTGPDPFRGSGIHGVVPL